MHIRIRRARAAYHGSYGELEELRLGRIELVEQREGLVDHLVILVVGQVHEGRRDLVRVEVGRRVEHGTQLLHAFLLQSHGAPGGITAHKY